jgi:hypothetical protein
LANKQVVPDEVLLPLKERLADWQDYDVAGFFLGKALGVIPAEDTWWRSKGLFWGGGGVGFQLINVLDLLVDLGFLERQDDEGQYRWVGAAAGHSADDGS